MLGKSKGSFQQRRHGMQVAKEGNEAVGQDLRQCGIPEERTVTMVAGLEVSEEEIELGIFESFEGAVAGLGQQ